MDDSPGCQKEAMQLIVAMYGSHAAAERVSVMH